MSERMLFCLGDGKYEKQGEGYQKNNRVFNVQVTEIEFNKIKSNVPDIKLPVTKWIEEKEMTDEEKENNENYKTLGGYLKTLSYEDAWKSVWDEMSQEDKAKFLAIPHFDNEIFKEITGIDVNVEPSLSGKEVKVEIDGKKYVAIIK
jgi:hypothetical protein